MSVSEWTVERDEERRRKYREKTANTDLDKRVGRFSGGEGVRRDRRRCRRANAAAECRRRSGGEAKTNDALASACARQLPREMRALACVRICERARTHSPDRTFLLVRAKHDEYAL